MPVRALAAVLLLSVAGWPPVGPPPDLSAAYPNPAYPDDDGEFVLLDVPANATLSAYELADGEDAIRLPATSHAGTIAVAANASAAELAGYPVLVVPEFLALSNAGETVTLRRASDGTVVDSLSYANARTAELQTERGSTPLGATTLRPVTVRDAIVTGFVLPDDPAPALDAIAGAERRVLLAGYTFTSRRVLDALLDADRRGVDVRVLLDGAPVGGDTTAQVDALDRLMAAGIEVTLVGGPRARYAFHHAKYAVADDAAVIVTENWKASGTGGRGNRGWGMVVHDPTFADALADVFESDADWTGTNAWSVVRDPASRDAGVPANGTYPGRFPATRVRTDAVTLAVAPDNAEVVALDVIEGADDSLRIQQVSLAAGRLQRAVVDAAERGVNVQILLSSRWYVREENRRLARCLNGYADRTGIPLSVRLVEPRSRFGKVHAKVAVADGTRILLGSLNWNEHALERNREVVVVATDDELAAYYDRVFRADWRGGAWRLPWSVLVATLLAVGVAGWTLSRGVEFDSDAAHPETAHDVDIWANEGGVSQTSPIVYDSSPPAGSTGEENAGERDRRGGRL